MEWDGWGVYSRGLSGIMVKINDDCESVTWVWDDENTEHHAKVYFTRSGRACFNAGAFRVHLDECIRTNYRRDVG